MSQPLASNDPDNASTRLANVPWSPWLGVIFVVIIYYLAQVIGGLLVSIYPASRHWTSSHTIHWLNNAVGAQFSYILLAEVVTIGAIMLFLKRYKTRPSAIGLRRPRWSDPFYGLAMVLPYYLLYVLTVGVVSKSVPGLNVNQQQDIGFTNVHGGLALTLTFISLVILPPITEEIMVRGFLYSTLKKGLGLAGAVLLTSLIFAAAHLPEGGAAGPLYIAALDTFVLSLVLIYLREKTGGLWASMTLHAIKNGIAYYALFVVHVH